MTVYELARELGNKMLETDEGKKLTDTRYVFDGDREAQAQLFNYSNTKAMFDEKIKEGKLTEAELATEAGKLNDLMEELKKNPVITDMLDAEAQFGVLVNQIMTIMNSTISGTDASGGCSGSCASCGGCH